MKKKDSKYKRIAKLLESDHEGSERTGHYGRKIKVKIVPPRQTGRRQRRRSR